jgi:hypothetical protein
LANFADGRIKPWAAENSFCSDITLKLVDSNVNEQKLLNSKIDLFFIF